MRLDKNVRKKGQRDVYGSLIESISQFNKKKEVVVE
jgi:hypothetical protein